MFLKNVTQLSSEIELEINIVGLVGIQIAPEILGTARPFQSFES